MPNPRLSTTNCDVVVAGGGPAGLSAALSLARAGLATALVTQPRPPSGTGPEARTAALFSTSFEVLDSLGVGDACRAESARLAGIRIIDDTTSLLKAPELLFESTEIEMAEFGYNVPNAVLGRRLGEACLAERGVTWFQDTSVTGLAADATGIDAELTGGERIRASVVVAADGKGSACRGFAGIRADVRETGQVAITANIVHSRPHRDVSTEFHRPGGPCTVVPLKMADENGRPVHASSLVWIERDKVAERLLALPDSQFITALAGALQGLLGAIHHVSPRARFDLSFLSARELARERVLLVGEAAHAVPPIGAQGLNLSLRDVAAATNILKEARAAGRDIGGPETLRAYADARCGDIDTRVTAIAALNGSLTLDLSALHLLRGAGLHALQAIPALRRTVMRAGLGHV